MTNLECYQNFCRLLGRLKANYQLSELVRTDGYEEWLKLAAEFAVHSFSQMHVASNAVHYVLGLWSRMVAAVPYVRVDTTADPMLDAYVPKVRSLRVTRLSYCLADSPYPH